MILPIVAYGHSVLRQVAKDIDQEHPQLDKLIADMWETMYSSNGVGLAAPQINKDIRLFVIDSAQIFESLEPHEIGKYPDAPGVKKVMINAKIVDLAFDVFCLTCSVTLPVVAVTRTISQMPAAPAVHVASE